MLKPVLRRVAGYVAVGGGLGVLLGLVTVSMAQNMFMFRFPGTGTGTFLALIGVVMLAALFAAAVPTLRVLSVEPSSALRSER